MKKLVCIAFATICLCACGASKEKTKTMKCSLESESNGLKTKMKIDMKYEGNVVYNQYQESIMSAESKEVYDVMLPTLRQYYKEDEYSNMKGMKYSIKEDEKKLSIKEIIDIDFKKISADDYKIVSGDSTTDISKNKINVDKTKTNLEKQGFTCQK